MEGDVDLDQLLSDLRYLVQDLRDRSADRTGVMYYRDSDQAEDSGRRVGYDSAADELESVVRRHFGKE